METQNIWRTVSVTQSSGVFVWEVMEYVGEEAPHSTDAWTLCRDGSWVFAMCYHYWLIETAEKHLNEQDLANYGAVYHTL